MYLVGAMLDSFQVGSSMLNSLMVSYTIRSTLNVFAPATMKKPSYSPYSLLQSFANCIRRLATSF